MRMLRSILALAVGLSVLAVPAFAATLRPQILVDGPQIRLGDLFDDLAAQDERIVGKAPAPGQRRVYRVSQILGLARAHGIAWRPPADLRRIIVRRAGTRVDRQAIEAALREGFAARGIPEDLEIVLGRRQPNLFVPLDRVVSVAVQSLDVDRRNLRFVARLVAPAEGPERQTLRLEGQAHRLVQLPVPARTIASGSLIAAGALQHQSVRAARIPPNAVREADRLIGQAAQRTLRAGQPVRHDHVGRPLLVHKGRTVTMALEGRGFSLTTLGRALDDGGEGDLVRAMNLQSRRVVQLMVVGPSLLSVPRAPDLAEARR